MTFLRKLGPQIPQCFSLEHCPDILELADGDFAVIGLPVTAEVRPCLPAGVSCGPHEAVVRIPRRVLVEAKRDIPDVV